MTTNQSENNKKKRKKGKIDKLKEGIIGATAMRCKCSKNDEKQNTQQPTYQSQNLP